MDLTAQNDIYTDRVLVDILHRLLRVQPVLALDGDGHQTALDLEVARELLERHLRVRAHDDVRAGLVDALAGGFAFRLPDALHSEAAQLNSLGGAGGGGADRVVHVGRVP